MTDLWSRVPPPWRQRLEGLAAVLREHRLPSALVGGCVRDLLLGRAPKDWDVIVEGNPGDAVKAFSQTEARPYKEHPAFRTFSIDYGEGQVLDVATARTETYAKPGALPKVRPAPLAADPARRDFSVNALYLRLTPAAGEIWDPLEGRRDMEAGVVRFLHEKSFEDDPTRVYRAARYAGRFGWTVEPKTRAAVDRAVQADLPLALSMVRRRNELFHLLEEENPAPALGLLWNWGMWKYWSPHWALTIPLQNKVAGAPPDLAARLAALFPDAAAAENWLKAAQAPAALRRTVVRSLGATEK